MRRATRDEWKRRVDNWRTSGLSARSYALRHGFSQSALYRWSKLFQPDAATVQLAVVKITPPEDLPAAEVPAQAAAQVRVDNEAQRSHIPVLPDVQSMDVVALNGWTVRIRPGFDPQLLTAVLSALEASAC